jgi:hypothetical protein
MIKRLVSFIAVAAIVAGAGIYILAEQIIRPVARLIGML